jgi:signal transduction histidine kinase/CheY-like chemotaxis protein
MAASPGGIAVVPRTSDSAVPQRSALSARILPAYLFALAIGAAGLAVWLAGAYGGPSSFWPLLLLMLLAAVAERGTVLLSGNLAASVSLVPMLLAAVALGPIASMIVGAASMLGDLRPPTRWAVYSLSGSITGGITGLVALAITDVLGRDVGGIMAATGAAAVAAQALDAAFCVVTLRVRRTGGLADVAPLVPTLALSATLYAPLVAALVLAYERVSPWTLVLFLVPSVAAHRLLVLYRRQRSLADEIASVNAHLRRRDAMLEAVSDAAQRFLETSSLDRAVEQMLADLGAAAEADHVCVLEGSGQGIELRYAWSAVDAAALPAPATIARDGTLVPILAGQQRWGLIGFPRRDDGREWAPAEVEGLRAAAGLLGAAIERRRAEEELRARDDQLRHAQKMEAIGRLAGGIAHDFNNLLTAIDGYSSFLLSATNLDDPRHADALEIHKAAERAAELTRQLLAFSRKQRVSPEIVDMNDVLRENDVLLRRLLGEQVELELDLDDHLQPILADRSSLQQIVLNLTVNARDAMPDGGRLLLQTRNVASSAATQGASVVLEVADTGHGMDAATRARIFEPFFTTKEVGKGTGLGLATVHGVVEQSGGQIEVESEPGRGTLFRISFPTAAGKPSSAVPPDSPRPEGGSETILLVEDEETVRDLASRILRSSGYIVLEAANADEALVLAERKGTVDLLLTDVVMPRTSGRELAEELARRHAFGAVVFMSGYTADPMIAGIRASGEAGFLPKPFTPDALLRIVRDALDAPPREAELATAPGVSEQTSA